METEAFGKPIRDREPLRRLQLARSSQRRSNPHATLHTPIEATPRTPQIVSEGERRAEKESPIQGMGCHNIRGRRQRLLKSEHDIVWYPPSHMNTNLISD
jgi:hypothetical protein